MRRTTLLALCLSCAGPEPVVDLGGEVFWEEIDFDAAIDMGHDARPIPEDEQQAPGPISLVEVTEAAGLTQAISVGNQHGVGMGFVDLDGDDFADIVVANGHNNRSGQKGDSLFYRNLGDGTFEDVSEDSGITAALGGKDCSSVAAGDYDRDGDVDLYVTAQPTDVLLQNDGTGVFMDVTADAGAGGPPSDPELASDGRSKIAAFGDMDADGDLDIVAASGTFDTPKAYLLRNEGDGTFTDITASSGVFAHEDGHPCAVMWSDYEADGLADIHIWNDRGGHVLLHNDGGGTFSDATSQSGLDAVTITHPMGIDAGDMDQDGDLDYYVSNIGNNPLLQNFGDGTFVDVTSRAGTGGEYGWGLGFEDLDRDGWVDIFVGQEDNRPHLVFRNEGEDPVRFSRTEIEHEPVLDSLAAHNVPVAFADYDHDGRIDVLVGGTDGRSVQLYRNETELGSAQWLDISVRPDGPESPDGIGARVAIKTGDLIQFDDINGGSSRASQNEHTVRFGLGHWDGAEWVAVLWATGRQQVYAGVQAGQRLVLEP